MTMRNASLTAIAALTVALAGGAMAQDSDIAPGTSAPAGSSYENPTPAAPLAEAAPAEAPAVAPAEAEAAAGDSELAPGTTPPAGSSYQSAPQATEAATEAAPVAAEEPAAEEPAAEAEAPAEEAAAEEAAPAEEAAAEATEAAEAPAEEAAAEEAPAEEATEAEATEAEAAAEEAPAEEPAAEEAAPAEEAAEAEGEEAAAEATEAEAAAEEATAEEAPAEEVAAEEAPAEEATAEEAATEAEPAEAEEAPAAEEASEEEPAEAAAEGEAEAAEAEEAHIEDIAFSFEGPFGKYDQFQLQRGLQVYTEVCAACHGLRYVPLRTLADPGGPELPENQVRAYAANYDIYDPETDEDRPRIPTDHFPTVSGEGMGPDLSLMAKARAGFHGPYGTGISQLVNGIGGPEYIHAILTGYNGETKDEAGSTFYHNAAFAGNWIQMPEPLSDDLVTYEDGTPATVDQMARDVSAFLMWTAEPKMMDRKEVGFVSVIFLILLSALLYLTNKKLWWSVKHPKKPE